MMYSDAINSEDYVRPVINLKLNVPFTGNGTFDAPYAIPAN